METYDAGHCGLLPVGLELISVEGPHIDGIGYDDPETTFIAFAGTKFDPFSEQHRKGSDAMRYAIGIQVARDAKDYGKADAIRDRISHWYHVGTAKDRTQIRPKIFKTPRFRL